MGNWVSVYTDVPQRIASIPGSSDKTALAEILAAHPALNHNAKEATYLARLIDGQFECVESEEGGDFLYAFQKICETYSPSKTTVEIYLDEDQFPAMWQFAFEANETPHPLPVSSWGNPSVGFWPHRDVQRFITVFESLDFVELARATGNSGGYQAEIREVVQTLKLSDGLGRGVYVFVNE